MKLDYAMHEAVWIVENISFLCEKHLVVGSIRRQRSEVNDIDIVVIPKAPREQNWDLIAKELKHLHGMRQCRKGPKLMTFAHYGDPPTLSYGQLSDYSVDVYHASPETWGVILLVRTGSKDHNVKLCSLARSKGLKLSAAEGVVTQEGFGQIIASKTEEEIFAALGMPYVEPKDREV